MNSNKESEILKIIETLTTTGKKTLDEAPMKQLKKICKTSNDYVNYAYYALMTQLRKEHSEIRYSALLIINELFIRSTCMRHLIEKNLSEFLELVIETNLDRPLPKPWVRAKDLKLKGLEFIQSWSSAYGVAHRRLPMALQYLKYRKNVDFNDMEARSVAERQQQQREQERQERILNEKVDRIRTEMLDMSGEISNSLIQMDNCFRLLIPNSSDELFSSEDFDNPQSGLSNQMEVEDSVAGPSVQSERGPENSLRQHGIYDMKKTITIEVKQNSGAVVKTNEDTLPIIDNLNDLYKEMTNRFLPRVTNWLKILTKGNNCTDSLKKAIDLKQLIESAFKKYKDLKLKNNIPNLDDDDEEEDDFVEVKEKEGFETDAYSKAVSNPVSNPKPSCSKQLSTVEKARQWKFKHSEDDVKDPTSAVSTLSKRISKAKYDIPSPKKVDPSKPKEKKGKKSELLNKAPVLPYDIDLYHWEEEKPLIPEVVKFDSLHNFWESKNTDEQNEALKEAQMASLRTRKIDFSGKFEPVKWSCRAPLPSGKLCPRKDRYKCPFHGKIIKRDPLGNPVDVGDVAGPSTSKDAVPDWQDPALLQDIEAATGMNLKLPLKKGKRKGPKVETGLTDITSKKTSARERISKKLLKGHKNCARTLDEIDRKRFDDKFGDQWNYY